jgi:hypothetical protein
VLRSAGTQRGCRQILPPKTPTLGWENFVEYAIYHINVQGVTVSQY